MIIIAFINKLNPPPSVATTLDNLLSAAYFITAITTLMASLLIAYRINPASKEAVLNHSGSRKTFMRIVEITVQSAIVYSIVALINAISGVIPSTDANSLTVFNLENWTITVFAAISVRTLQF